MFNEKYLIKVLKNENASQWKAVEKEGKVNYYVEVPMEKVGAFMKEVGGEYFCNRKAVLKGWLIEIDMTDCVTDGTNSEERNDLFYTIR